MPTLFTKDRLIELFREARAVKIGGPWKLASGAESDFYVDVRKVVTRPLGALVAADGLLDCLQAVINSAAGLPGKSPVYVVGGGVGGGVLMGAMLAWCAPYADKEVRALIVRDRPKGHGTGRLVEGELPPAGTRPYALIVDDVLTSGGSILRFADAVKDLVEVRAAAVVVDREEGGAGALSEYFTLGRLLTRSDLTTVALR